MPRKEIVARWRRLIAYMYDKAADHDWHGVMDAAADLREMEAKHPFLYDLEH